MSADQELVRQAARPGRRATERAAPPGPGERRTSDERGGRARVRPLADRPGARGPRPATSWPRAGRRRRRTTRRRSPARSTPRCSGSAGCSRCSTTPRSRTSTSTAATRSSSSTATAARRDPGPVAESDEELVELIQVLAAHAGLTSRPFDSANPQLDLRLPDGSRLSAVMGVTARPAVSIRRARLGRVFLDDLVANGTMSDDVGVVPAGGGRGPQEHHDRRRDQRREDDAAARAGQRDPAGTSG